VFATFGISAFGTPGRSRCYITANGVNLRVLMNSEQYLGRVVARKMSNFPPTVVIWWLLKMYTFGK